MKVKLMMTLGGGSEVADIPSAPSVGLARRRIARNGSFASRLSDDALREYRRLSEKATFEASGDPDYDGHDHPLENEQAPHLRR